MFLGLPKRKHFDPFVCADICEHATSNSYSKTGRLVAEKIGKRTSNNINISRATARNIVIAFNPNLEPEKEELKNYLLCLMKNLLVLSLIMDKSIGLKQLLFLKILSLFIKLKKE